MIDAAPTLTSAQRLAQVMTALLLLPVIGALATLFLAVTAPIDLSVWLAAAAAFPVAPLGGWQATGLIGLLISHLILWFTLLLTAREMFAQIGAGDIDAAGRLARRLALLLWTLLAWGIVSHAIGSVLATIALPEGERMLSVSLGTAQVSVALAALIASFLAHAFSLGAALWRDHRAVI
ncbi:MAG: hypothetical protein ACU0DW_12690 [Shimia sp.]